MRSISTLLRIAVVTVILPLIARAQLENSMTGVPVKIWVESLADDYENPVDHQLSISGTFMSPSMDGSSGYYVESDSTEIGGGIRQALLAYSSSHKYVRLEPGKSYELAISGQGYQGYFTLAAVPPPGYEVIINDKKRQRIEDGGGTITVTVKPARSGNPHRAGMASQLGKLEVDWSVSLGSQKNGTSAGELALVQTGFRTDWSPLYTPAALNCEPASEEVYVHRDSNVVRQIVANQIALDIVTINSTSYEIRCYNPTQLSGSTYPKSFTGQPYVTYRVAKGGTDTTLNITREFRDVTNSTGTGFSIVRTDKMSIVRTGSSWPSYTWTKTEWTLDGQTALSQVVVAGGGTSSARTETVEVKTPGGTVATKVVKNFGIEASILEALASETLGTTSSSTASFDYYDDTSKWGSFGYLKSASLPGGGWAAFDYYDDTSPTSTAANQVKYKYAPFVSSPSSVSHTTSTGAVTYFEYVNDEFGAKTRPSLMETKINNTLVEKTVVSYNDSVSLKYGPWYWPSNFVAGAEVTTTKYVNSSESLTTVERTYSRGYFDSLVRGQPWSITRPDGTKRIYNYSHGDWSGSSFNFWGGGSSSYLVVVEGIAQPIQGTVSMTTSSQNGLWGGDTLYLVDGRSTMEVVIRDSRSLVARTENHIWKNNAWQLVGYTDYTYDFCGRLTTKVGNNGATYTATWVADRRTDETDEFGIKTEYTYDYAGRVATKTRVGSGAIGTLVTQYTYDAADRVTQETVGYGQSNPLVTSKTFDDSGRVTAENPPGNYGAVTHSYNVSSRTHTVTKADGGTTIAATNIDGSVASMTGTSVVAQYQSYGVESDGRRWARVDTGTSSSARWAKNWTDWVGRAIKTEKPGFTGQANVVEENFYDEYSRRTKSTRTGYAPTLYQYDLLGKLVRTGLDLDGDGFLNTFVDRVTDSDTYLESYSSQWWLRTDARAYPLAGSDTAATVFTRKRLTGFISNRLSEEQQVDAEGNVTTIAVDVNRSSKTATKTTTKTGVSNSQVENMLNGYATSVTNVEGLATDFAYDSLLRRTTTTDSRGSPRNVTTTAYIAGTMLVSTVTDAATYVVEANDYYATGAVKWTRDAKNHYTRFSYNLRGQLEKQWGDGSMPVSYGYDSTYGDRTTISTYRAGTSWDGTTWPSSPGTADTTTWAYDGPSGLITSKTDAASRAVSYTYNVRGQTATRTWARGTVTTYSYDSNTGDALSQTYSDSTPSVTYTYDRAGRVASITDTTGTRDMVYDPAKPWRLSAEALGTFYGSRVLTRLYGETGTLGRIRGFQLGANTGSISELEQIFGYNSANGRLETVTSSRLGGADSRTFRYAYLSNSSLLQSLSIDSGGGPGGHPFTITRTYEATRDVITSVEAKWSTTSMSKFVYTYDERRNRSSVVQSGDLFADYGDSTFRLFAYNGRGELTADIGYLGSSTADTSKPLPSRRHGYDYDTAGNRKWSDNTGIDTSPADGAFDLRDDYTTNALNQYVTKENNTISVSGTAGVDSNPSATNPSNGDTRVAIKGQTARAGRQGKYWSDEVIVANNDHVSTPHPWRGPLVVYTAKRDSGADLIRAETRMAELPGRVQNLTYDYDGNITSDGVYDYTWDAENRLTEVKTSTFSLAGTSPYQYRRVAFRYDYMGRRVQKRVLEGSSSAETETSCKRFLYDGWSQVAEYAAPGASAISGLVRSYTWGIDIAKSLSDAGGVGALLQIAEHPTSKTYVPSYDGNGNIVALFDTGAGSSAAACVATYEYSPYGKLLRSEGAYAKENSFRFSTKFTDDETSLVYYGRRYYSSEQGRFLGRDPIEEQGGLNLYGFVRNNPVNRWDILGMWTAQEVEALLAHLDMEIGESHANIDELESQIREQTDLLNYERGQLRYAEGLLGQLEGDVKRYQWEIREKEAEKSGLETQSDDLTRVIQRLGNQLSGMQEDFATKKQEYEDMLEMVDKAWNDWSMSLGSLEDFADASRKASQMAGSLEKLRGEISTVESAHNGAVAQRDDITQKISAISDDINLLNQKSSDATADIALLKTAMNDSERMAIHYEMNRSSLYGALGAERSRMSRLVEEQRMLRVLLGTLR